MTHPKRARRSEWRVLERCLKTLQLLLRGPVAADAIRQIIIDDAVANDQTLTVEEINRRFEEDRSRLRHNFGCTLEYTRAEDTYQLTGLDKPLIDLSEAAIRGLAFLRAAFRAEQVPNREIILPLIDEVTRLLPAGRQRAARRESGFIEMRFGLRDRDSIPDEVREAVQRACDERRQLEIRYRPASRADGLTLRHLLEPYRVYFDARQGHELVEGWWLESESTAYGRRIQDKFYSFRLGRIQEAKVLPTHFIRRRLPTKELTYRLSPKLARGGVSQQFEGSQIHINDDGSVTVRAQSVDLFTDLRALLRYGPECVVMGGEDARTEMRHLVQAMWEQYSG